MDWTILKKAFKFSLRLRLTGTRLLSIALFIFMWLHMGDIPPEGRAFFGITISGIIVFLYTGKMLFEYKQKEKEETK